MAKGIKHAMAGRHNQALKSFDKALRLAPNEPALWFNKGNLLSEMHRLKEALVCFEKTTTIVSNNPQVWFAKGITLERLQRYQDAIDCFDKVLAITPDNPEAWLRKGINFGSLKSYEKALSALDKALSIQPNHPEILFYKGIALRASGQDELAINVFKQAIRVKPDFAEAWCQLGMANMALYKFDTALTSYNKSLALNPDYREALLHFGLGYIYQNLEDYDISYQHFEKANKLCALESEHDLAGLSQKVETLLMNFKPELRHQVSGSGYTEDQSILIIGLPRTGKTMLENIIGLSSNTAKTGESAAGILSSTIEKRMPQLNNYTSVSAIQDLDGNQVTETGRESSTSIRELHEISKRVIGTAPNLDLHVGIALLSLPNLKIIHVARNREDNIFEIFTKQFASHAYQYTYNIPDISEKYDSHHKIMSHWKKIFPDSIHTINFEDLLCDPEMEIKRILEFCDLPYENEYMEYMNSNYSSMPEKAIGVWKHYEKHLKPYF
ncbi:hypothetical protein BOW34_00055 [Solemya velum gill symbiont]|nr:hypothetical protein BOW27_00055 [Solemya velum gill symbiont]OOZ23096.1 hypothetical protein BOW30_02835 [Solemya velum gill symbiont]OOZ30220.1 hypothetical protein BOW33_01860 [Solemya velum gill symbiont]OOZ33295.1 hypothetical protein BOW34_00055 [Solemya velum gill symbiont]